MVSGRMDVILGAGPQYLTLMQPGNGTTIPASTTHQLTVAARAVLRYRMPRQSISLAYNRHTTAGSGIHYGSQTDDIRATLSRPLSRLWTSSVDVGYAHNQALLTATPTTNGTAINGSYQSGFAGGGLTRRLGRYFSLQMHYQYTYELFNHNTVNGGNSLNRNIGDITLSWHPAPIRLD